MMVMTLTDDIDVEGVDRF